MALTEHQRLACHVLTAHFRGRLDRMTGPRNAAARACMVGDLTHPDGRCFANVPKSAAGINRLVKAWAVVSGADKLEDACPAAVYDHIQAFAAANAERSPFRLIKRRVPLPLLQEV